MTTELIEVRQIRVDELVGEKGRALTGQSKDTKEDVPGRVQEVGGKVSLKQRKHFFSLWGYLLFNRPTVR